MAGLAFCGRSFDCRAFDDLPGRESCRREFPGRDDGERFESGREDCGRFVSR